MAKAAAIRGPDQGAALGADNVRSLITPEGVDLHLRLADVGQRATAMILDLLLMTAIYVLFSIALILGLVALHQTGSEGLLVLWLVAGFLLRNFYFIGFELSPRAATPGKRRSGIRVASRNGGRLTADAIFVRNALRELEVFLPLSLLFTPADMVGGWIKAAAIVWCAAFVLLPMFNRDRLRAGDLLGGTWVVRVPDVRLLRDLAHGGADDARAIHFTHAQLDAYGIKELQVLETVLRKYDAKTVAAVAARIREKIGFPEGAESNGAFLNAYYAALRHRLEARALMGRRRADKYDKG